MGNRHLGWIAAWGVVTALFGLLTISYWLAARAARSGLPLWPIIPFAAIAVIGLAMVFAPVFRYWPFRPPRHQRRGAIAASNRERVADEAVKAQRAAAQKRQREEAAKQWWGRASTPLPPSTGSLTLELHNPEAHGAAQLSDATAYCEVTRSADVWRRSDPTPIPFDAQSGSFIVTFPEDFAGFTKPPPPPLSPNVIEYCAWWESEAIEGRFRHQRFRVGPWGTILLNGLDPDHPRFNQP